MKLMTSEDAGLTARVLLLLVSVAVVFVFLAFAAKAHGQTSLARVVPQVASKAREILQACPGTKIVSTIARRGNKSFHPAGRAVDITGNPKCVKAQLANWRGGVSTDYWSVQCPTKRGWIKCPHYHFDNGPYLRFAHRRPNRMFTAYAEAKAVRE